MQKGSIKLLEIFSKKAVFQLGDGNRDHILPTITKQYNNGLHSFTKLTPTQASLIQNEGFVYHNLSDKRKRMKPKYRNYDRSYRRFEKNFFRKR